VVLLLSPSQSSLTASFRALCCFLGSDFGIAVSRPPIPATSARSATTPQVHKPHTRVPGARSVCVYIYICPPLFPGLLCADRAIRTAQLSSRISSVRTRRSHALTLKLRVSNASDNLIHRTRRVHRWILDKDSQKKTLHAPYVPDSTDDRQQG